MGLTRAQHAYDAPTPIGVGGKFTAGEANATATSRQPNAADQIYDQILERIEPALAVRMSREALVVRIEQLVAEIADQRRLLLNEQEQQSVAAEIVDDMIGLGPLEPLLHDELGL